ncbi:hypothetical protein WR25_02224 [Diploscapter pachys]|uniref:Peptidase M12A domain-containing protein n=1 Tax=Diploscapter pachys TaxID=2018661 RepID=A0A2A2M0V2_9BILA|nr:hypothetical protein WR25_02224 [Diploscapter pachys]
MRQILRYSTVSKLLLLFLIANVSADERLKRQAGTTVRKWALNNVYYYFDPSLTTAQQTLANRVMKSIIQPSTCISFVVNATARNRVKIISNPTIDFCESSNVGCKGGEQTDGAFAKAIFHVLGFYTMERRSDRDNLVNINSNSVNPAMTDGLAIINSTYSTNLLGYNFGSVIHSTHDMFVYGGSTDYPILPKDNAYFYTMGGPIVTSYDLNMLQLFYYCNSEYQCTISATFVLQFRATNTNVTDIKPPPPPFLPPMDVFTKIKSQICNNVYKHVHIDIYKHVHIDIYKHVHIDIYKHVHIDAYNYYYNRPLSHTPISSMCFLQMLSIGTQQLRTAWDYAPQECAIYQGFTANSKAWTWLIIGMTVEDSNGCEYETAFWDTAPRVPSTLLEIWIGTVRMARAEAANLRPGRDSRMAIATNLEHSRASAQVLITT